MDDISSQMIEILINQNNQFQSTLQFAVNAIITILVIFLGAQFFTLRSHKKDELEKIKSEIILNLQNNYISNLREELRKELKEEIEEELANDVSRKLKEINRNITSLEFENKDKNRQIEIIKIELKILEGGYWTIEKIHLNALFAYTDAGKISLGEEGGYGHLEDIIEKIDKTLDHLDKITSYHKTFVQEMLNKLPDNFKTSKEALENKLLGK
ncbi:hypothetical protein [Evansella clarkii]|uniref:hypothetical protein n=1 Tax=Evansella clarkii TaxID=79879 RepID=UPI0009982260|nr:hypothetical protein [Evansella clarkii]